MNILYDYCFIFRYSQFSSLAAAKVEENGVIWIAQKLYSSVKKDSA